MITAIMIMVLTGCSEHGSADEATTGPDPNVPRLTDEVETTALHWTRCAALRGAPDPSTPGLRCAGLAVPRDYAHPERGTLTVAVSRLTEPQQADHPTSTRPVLVSNPGGPGASGLFNSLGIDAAFGGRLRDTFDLVSFDPRGVNRSVAVDCKLTTTEAAGATAGRAPSTFEADAAFAEQVAGRCAAQGVATSAVTTNNTVRDAELLRRALGQDRISWVGTSYGTELAAGYATVFPDHTDRVVLDSPSDMTRPWWQVQAGSAQAADARFDQLATVIADQNEQWGLGGDVPAVRASYLAAVRRLDTTDVRLGTERITAVDLQSARLGPALLDNGAIEPLAQSLRYILGVRGALSAGDLIDFLDRADRSGGSSTEVNGQSLPQQIAAYYAVRCNDTAWPSGVDHYRTAVAAEVDQYPITRGQFSMINACAFWPTVTREPMIMITDRGWSGPANILMLSASGDYRAYAAGVANTRRALGRRAVAITTDDYHHVVAGRNACATDAARHWLLRRAETGSDRRCG